MIEQEENNERKGIYKNADLLKMHAYKDAIRRTGGAYILYPGTETQKPLKGFHEIIPGLGAFAIKPSSQNNGVAELGNFIDSVINHLLDRASQREYAAVKNYEIHKIIFFNVCTYTSVKYAVWAGKKYWISSNKKL